MQQLILIRGLPGSGKSTLARALAGDARSIEADDYFVSDGVYRFDPAQLPQAHAACQAQAQAELAAGRSVVVANTFSQRWEMEPYMLAARECGARVVVADLYDGGLDDSALAARGVHGVPVPGIAAMRARWEHRWSTGYTRPAWERR
jgi:predicted kinase